MNYLHPWQYLGNCTKMLTNPPLHSKKCVPINDVTVVKIPSLFILIHILHMHTCQKICACASTISCTGGAVVARASSYI